MRPFSAPLPGAIRSSRRPGFTLVELIIVILIVAVIMAIVLPALGAARNAVRKTQSQSTMNQLLNAYQTYRNDNDGRAPGRFTQRELGSNDNISAGFTVMENALLDLLGTDAVIGRVSDVDFSPSDFPGYDSTNEDIIKVGISVSEELDQYYVNTALLGAGDGAYFIPEADTFEAQIHEGDPDFAKQITASPATAPGNGQFAVAGGFGVAQMPDLVDAFGQPLLLWVPDDFAPVVRTTDVDDALDDFVLDPQDAGNAERSAVFYPSANIGFLASKSLGRKGEDMTRMTSSGEPTSAIGFESPDASGYSDNRRRTFMALMGNAAFPAAAGTFNSIADAVAADSVVPAKPRGQVIIQSAGIDGIYFSTGDGAFRAFGSVDDRLEYHQNFNASGATFDNNDLTRAFDDVLITSN